MASTHVDPLKRGDHPYASAQLGRVTAPTQITFGRHDQVTSLRFSDALTGGIKGSELVVFETAARSRRKILSIT